MIKAVLGRNALVFLNEAAVRETRKGFPDTARVIQTQPVERLEPERSK